MIVQITMLKNELFLIKKLLPIWKKYVDGFIFLDDHSTDGSWEFLNSDDIMSKYNILDVLRTNRGANLWIETDERQRLFDCALKHSNKIICLDADEYLDGRMTKDELEDVLSKNTDVTVFLKWIQYTSCNTVRIDGPWKNNLKDRIGTYSSDIKFERRQTHSTHLPINKKSISLSEDMLFIAHLQWLDKNYVGIKQYFWKVTDFVNNRRFGCEVVDSSAYDASVNNFNWEEMYFGYPLQIPEDIFENENKFENYRLKFIIENTTQYNIPNLGDWNMNIHNSIPMYFCTAADEKHYGLLLNMIGSLHENNFYDIASIDVYNLGLTEFQISELNNIKKVNICEVEKTNSEMLNMINTGKNRDVRGLFSWKPVVIKQSLSKYPYVLYLDAGTTILKPLNSLFKQISTHGYFFTSCGHSIKWMTTDHVKNLLDIKCDSLILSDSTEGIDAGFMGISNKIYDSFIYPIYQLSFDISNFRDDGSCPDGFGCGRHDQTLFSVFCVRNGYFVFGHENESFTCRFSENELPFVLTHSLRAVTESTSVFRSRWNVEKYKMIHRISNIKRHYKISAITGIGPSNIYGSFIDSWLEDIKGQVTFEFTEHIVVYSEWCEAFNKLSEYKNIILLKEDSPGVYNAWNRGIANATTEYITNWNIDDRRHPFANKIKYDLLRMNDLHVAYNLYVASYDNETFNTLKTENKSVLMFPDSFENYCMSDCLVGPDPMWKKSLHYFSGVFDNVNFPTIGDWEMWIRFSINGFKFKLLPMVLGIYGCHDNTISNRGNKNIENEKFLLRQRYTNVKTNSAQITFKKYSDL